MAYAYDPQNIFARILRGEIPNKTVLDTAHTLAFHDISPAAPVHVLVIPKQHIATLADAGPQHAPLLGHMLALAPRLMRDLGFRAADNEAGWIWRGRERQRPERRGAARAGAFAALAELRRG